MDIIVVDIETTHLDEKKGMIIEFALVTLDLDDGTIDPIFYELCKEEGWIDPKAWIFDNSSLTYEMVKTATLLKEFKSQIQLSFDRFPVTCFYHEFDFPWLKNRGFDISAKFWDPMKILAPVMKLPYKNGTRGKWPTFQKAWDFLFPDEKHRCKHRALDDAVHEAKMIYKIYSEKMHINHAGRVNLSDF